QLENLLVDDAVLNHAIQLYSTDELLDTLKLAWGKWNAVIRGNGPYTDHDVLLPVSDVSCHRSGFHMGTEWLGVFFIPIHSSHPEQYQLPTTGMTIQYPLETCTHDSVHTRPNPLHVSVP